MRSRDGAGARVVRDGPGARLLLDDGRPVNILTERRLGALAGTVRELAAGPDPPHWLVIEGNSRGSFAGGPTSSGSRDSTLWQLSNSLAPEAD